ncbi:hypothetical protein ABTQ33_05665 [Paucilactobacillus suebicus]|uniref:Uncharacterized protein n=1 Tax=Paucilactobacillus suebicus DSM 5007 = KCTC 3549 TaxID=1423807 RepID=A0A0R1WD42_9LACO|nr:hypothetical protein [Paucilactobacillus suebicus]KRM12790.1 hypothetical protein FD16_GL001968 [Paucilactobacillus suebicus DSM 5007 = KCTC 3549]
MDIFELAYRFQQAYRDKYDELVPLGYSKHDIKAIRENSMTEQLPTELVYKMANDYIMIEVRTMRGDRKFNDQLETLRQKLLSDNDTKIMAELIDRQAAVNVWLYDKYKK